MDSTENLLTSKERDGVKQTSSVDLFGKQVNTITLIAKLSMYVSTRENKNTDKEKPTSIDQVLTERDSMEDKIRLVEAVEISQHKE